MQQSQQLQRQSSSRRVGALSLIPFCLGISGHPSGSRQGHPRYTGARSTGRPEVARTQFSTFFSFFFFFFFLFSLLFLLFDPIPSPEERFICSQFCFCFQLVWVLAPIRRIVRGVRSYIIRCSLCALTIHACLVHSCIQTFHSAIVRKKIIASWYSSIPGGCTLVHVGTGVYVFWYCGYWNSGYEHRDGLTRPWSKLWRISSNS